MKFSTVSKPSRLFIVLVLAELPTIVGVSAQEHSEQFSPKVNVTEDRMRATDGPLVGAYYYPWFSGEDQGRPRGRFSWRQVFRQQLDPPQSPRAGLYSSDDPVVIKGHIQQSRRAGISFWAVSWWGPGTPTDRTFHDAILDHPDASQLRFAALYETTGRFGEANTPSHEHWKSDLEYLDKHYFRHPNYLRIDGRPVLFVYLTRVYFRAMIRDVALPNLDNRCGRLMMVTSFNEWYEDTQIEATAGTAPATIEDQSADKKKYTGGDRYEDYSYRYLDILRETGTAGEVIDR